MAQRHAQKGNKRDSSRKKSKSSKKVNVVIWGVILAVLLGAVIFVSSGYHERVKKKVQNAQYPLAYSEYVEKAAKNYNLDKNLIYAVIRTESSFNPDAGSSAGACGLMQITGDTFETYMNIRGESEKYSPDDLFDPAINIDYGCYILRDHLNTFGDEECAVAAYNAGPNSVLTWLNDSNISTDGKTLIVENIPYDETRDYVKKVEDAKRRYKELYGE